MLRVQHVQRLGVEVVEKPAHPKEGALIVAQRLTVLIFIPKPEGRTDLSSL